MKHYAVDIYWIFASISYVSWLGPGILSHENESLQFIFYQNIFYDKMDLRLFYFYVMINLICSSYCSNILILFWYYSVVFFVCLFVCFLLLTKIFQMLIFIPNFTLTRCIYKRISFSLAGSVLHKILALRSWLLMLCTHKHSVKVNLNHGLLRGKMLLLIVHNVTVCL